MNVFVIIVVFFVVGAALRFFASPPQRLTDVLNLFVVHIALPALILTIVPFLTFNITMLIPAVSYWLLVPATWLLSYLLARYFSWSRDIRCVFFTLCACGNTGFLGIPMAKALLSNEALAYALLYDQLGTFIGVATVITITIARYQSDTESTDVKYLVYKVMTFTPFVALICSLLLPIDALVTPLIGVLEFLAQLIVPATMIVVGLQFTLKIEKKYYQPLSVILLIKMLIMPLVMWGIVILLRVDPVMISSIVFQVAAPPMITAAALLMTARIAVPLVGSTLGLGTILSFITLPLWALLLV